MKHTKKQLIKTLTLATTVVLAGCNGGGGASSSTPSTPDTPSNPTTVYNLSPLKITVQSETESGVVLNDGKLDLSAVTGFHYVKVTLTNNTAYPIEPFIGEAPINQQTGVRAYNQGPLTFYKAANPNITFTGVEKVKNLLPTDCSNYVTVINDPNAMQPHGQLNNLPAGQSCTKEYYINEPTSLFIDGNESGEAQWSVDYSYNVGQSYADEAAGTLNVYGEPLAKCGGKGEKGFGYGFECRLGYDPNIQLNVTQSTSDLFSVIFPLTDKTLSMSNPSPNGAYILDMESSNGVYTGYRYTPTGFTDRLTYSNKSAGFNIPANFAIQAKNANGLQVDLDGKYAVVAGAVWDMSNPQSPQSMPVAGSNFHGNVEYPNGGSDLFIDSNARIMLDGFWYTNTEVILHNNYWFIVRNDLSNGNGTLLNGQLTDSLYGFGLWQAFPNGYKVIGTNGSATAAGTYCQAPDGTKITYSGSSEYLPNFNRVSYVGGQNYFETTYHYRADINVTNEPVDYAVDVSNALWDVYLTFDEKSCTTSATPSYIFTGTSGKMSDNYGLLYGKNGVVYLPSSAFPKQN